MHKGKKMKKWFGIGLCLVFGFSVFAKNMAVDIEEGSANDGVVDSLFELESLFIEHQYSYLPVSPPSLDVFTQDYGLVVPVRTANLPKNFIKRLVGEYNEDGIPVFLTTVYEDPITRQTVFLNVDGLEIYRLDPAFGYDPLAWQRDWFQLGSSELLDPWTTWIFDPAHIAARFLLVNDKDYEAYVLAEEQRRLEEIAIAPVMRTMGAGDGGSNMPVVFSADTNGLVSLTLAPPIGFGSYAEIFQKQNLIYPPDWNVAVNRMAVTNGIETVWVDPVSHSTMFYIGGYLGRF